MTSESSIQFYIDCNPSIKLEKYIPPLLSRFSFLRFSIQLKRRCSPPCHAFPSSCLVFPRRIRNFLAITYLDNFRKTCHFQVVWTPAILLFCFFFLVFPLTSTIEGHYSWPSTKLTFVFQSQQEAISVT